MSIQFLRRYSEIIQGLDWVYSDFFFGNKNDVTVKMMNTFCMTTFLTTKCQ